MDIYFNPQWIKKRFPELGEKALNALLEYARSKNTNLKLDSAQEVVDSYYELCVEQDDLGAQHLWTSFEQFNDNPTSESLAKLHQIPQTIDVNDRAHAVLETIIFKTAYRGFNILQESLLAPIKDIDMYIVQGNEDTEAPPIFARQLVDLLLKIKPELQYYFIDGKHSENSSDSMIKTLLACTNSFKKENSQERANPSISQSELLTNQGIFSFSLPREKAKQDENQITAKI